MSDTYSRQRREQLRAHRRSRPRANDVRRFRATDRATASILRHTKLLNPPALGDPSVTPDPLPHDKERTLP